MMERWSGVLEVPLHPNSGAYHKVAASFCLTSSRNFIVPSVNAIFFCGDRVEGTGNPVIEKLSNLQRISEILVSKFGCSINAWVIEASSFNGPFAVYRDFVPSVNQWGEPTSYDHNGFPASMSTVTLLSNRLVEANRIIEGRQENPVQATITMTDPCRPKTIILGFSKGGTVLNQLLTELAFSNITSTKISHVSDNQVIPLSKEKLLDSIMEIHYVDVGLNSAGAYLTDQEAIRRISRCALHLASGIRIVIHGTPRQWNDKRRVWIRKEKDELLNLLETEAKSSYGKFGDHLWLDVVSKCDLLKETSLAFATEDTSSDDPELQNYRKSGPDGSLHVSVTSEIGLDELKAYVHRLLVAQMGRIKTQGSTISDDANSADKLNERIPLHFTAQKTSSKLSYCRTRT